MELVPTVDISDPSATSLAAIDAACRDHGFFLLTGHGIDEVIEGTWDWTRRFFDADRSVRTAVVRTEANPLGYYDRELTKRRRDHKEVFDLIDPTIPALDARNRWPDSLRGFRDAMVRHFDACSDLAVRTLSLVHEALGLAADERASSACDRHTSTVRLNHYTVGDPVPANERGGLADLGPTALGYHTDPGVLTLLLQDDTGGLQAETADGTWIDVPPRPGTVVVNLGDCMQAWSNDRYRAAVHRVLPMTATRRFSIPYFSNPHRDAVVEPIPALSAAGPRYRPFPWREFMAARAYDNFTDLGADDTQVTDFRIEAR
ncbi:MAG: isopenicillin N synthase family dioxygenase [Actinomycetes bacterium]